MRSKFPGVKYYRTENNGVSRARNFGVEKAVGKYIAFLDSDDEWLPKKLERQMDLFSEGIRWVHGEERWIRRGVRVNQRKIHQKSGGDIFNRSLHLCLISPSTVVLEKSLFLEFNGFDESFIVCEDFDLWLRILAKFPVGFVQDECIIKYGGHEDQLSAKYKAMDHYRVKTFLKLINLEYLDDSKKREVALVAEKKCRILINGYKKHGHETKAQEIEKLLSSFLC